MRTDSGTSAYGFDLGKVAPLALVMGDPERASLAASLLQSPELIWDIREYRAFTGSLDGKFITVCSHGVGAPGAALVLSDLFRAGVRNIIRAGTCGSLSSRIKNGSFVVATAAIREDGATNQLLPDGFPAVADLEMTNALMHAAVQAGLSETHAGMVWSSALYYPSPERPSNLKTWSRCGVLASEMEMAVLFILASMNSARAGGILAVEADCDETGSPGQISESKKIAENRLKLIQVALSALVSVS